MSVAAIRMQPYGVQVCQASRTASDIDTLVRFEVMCYQWATVDNLAKELRVAPYPGGAMG